MRRLLTAIAFLPVAALSIDHTKLDFGRPLQIEDAHPLALGEMKLELGASVAMSDHNRSLYSFEVEFAYGIALNTHIEVGVEPTAGVRAGNTDRAVDLGPTSVGVFFGLTRESPTTPASAVAVRAHLPTGRIGSATDVSVTGIFGGQAGGFGRWHTNLGGSVAVNRRSGDRLVTFAGGLGYSQPIGLPYDFSQTFVSAISIRQSREAEGGLTGTLGVGLRRQIGIRDVLDVGVETDVFVTGASQRTPIRLIIGLSRSF